ncbi:MAG: hypothetical protein R3C18_06380 [Planctomycetaceae bacterium]
MRIPFSPLLCLVVLLFAGCVPEESRVPTTVKPASEVEVGAAEQATSANE